jgi:hypothetical protein
MWIPAYRIPRSGPAVRGDKIPTQSTSEGSHHGDCLYLGGGPGAQAHALFGDLIFHLGNTAPPIAPYRLEKDLDGGSRSKKYNH